MHRYSPDQIEFFMAVIGVMFASALLFPVARALERGGMAGLAWALAALPPIALAAVLVVFWRRFH